MISRNVPVFFKIVPEGHTNCQLSIVNCQFGEAAKQQFIIPFRFRYTDKGIKDCYGCLRPHRRENYGAICEKMGEILELAKRKENP